jgi:hypothetical protein
MKVILNILVIVFVSTTIGCVQPSYKKTILFVLNANQIQNIYSACIKGNDKPLSWDNGVNMKQNTTDSLYTTYITFVTGYQFIEMKFVVNDNFELADKPNRKIYFSEKDTTIYNAIFDKNIDAKQ